jgi:predicted ATP-dependent protease
MEGPSAGISVLLSLLRILARVRLQPEVAQTGVFLSSGMICAVGGLEAKLRCAKREGFKRCIIPADNYAAMEASGQLKALTDDKFKVVGARDVVDLLHLTLAGEAVLDLAEGLALSVLSFSRCVGLTPRRWRGCFV